MFEALVTNHYGLLELSSLQVLSFRPAMLLATL